MAVFKLRGEAEKPVEPVVEFWLELVGKQLLVCAQAGGGHSQNIASVSLDRHSILVLRLADEALQDALGTDEFTVVPA